MKLYSIYFSKIIIVVFFILFALIISVHSSFSQQLKTVKGALVDAENLTPLSFIGIELIRDAIGKKEFKKAALTNLEGQFSFTPIDKGKYTLKISVLNSAENLIEVNVLETDSVINLGVIKIKLTSLILNEVKVIAQNIISQDIDRIIYNVERDPKSLTANVLDILQKVPMLSVDGLGNIKLQGENNFRIFLNNKPSNLLVRNPSEVLRSIPASTIKSIEVITSPPVRYLSEGITGIININTKKKVENGVEGSLNFEYRTPGVGPAFSNTLSGKKDKFSFNSNIGFSDYEKPFTSRSIDRQTFGSNGNNFNQNGGNETFSDSKFFNLGLTYDVDILNLLTANLGLYNLGSEEILNLETSLNDLNGSILQQYLINSSKEAATKELGFGLDYQRNFAGRKDKVLNISYLFTNARDGEENLTEFNQRFNFSTNDFKQSNFYNQVEHIGQIDFTQSVKKVKVDFGIKTIVRLGESDFNSTDIIGGMPFPTSLTQFVNNQYIYSFYNSYQYKFKKWGFIGAYRFEYTNFKTQNSNNNIANSYQNFLPNFALNYNINGSESINFTYLKAIRRPNISYLNPFENKLNPNLEIVGNPNLLAITQNNFNIQYRRFKKSSLIVGLKYSFSNDVIQQILTNTQTEGVFRLTFSNIGKKEDLSTNVSFNQPVNKSINLNFAGNLIYTNLTGTVNGLSQNNSGFTGDVNLGFNFSLKDKTQLSSRVNYSAPSIFLQGQRDNFPYIIFGGSRSFFKNKLSLSGSLINPFSKLRNIESDYTDDNFVQNSLSESFFRQYQIRVNYRFGQLKKTSRTNRKGIQNNDAIGVKQ
jgi:hypothetical protein